MKKTLICLALISTLLALSGCANERECRAYLEEKYQTKEIVKVTKNSEVYVVRLRDGSIVLAHWATDAGVKDGVEAQIFGPNR